MAHDQQKVLTKVLNHGIEYPILNRNFFKAVSDKYA